MNFASGMFRLLRGVNCKLPSIFLVSVLLQQLCFGAQQNPAGSAAPRDIGWPRQVSKDGAQLVYYQPQVDDWKNYKELTGRMAFSLTPKGGQAVHGVASLHAITSVDKTSHIALLQNITATSVRFPSLDTAAAGSMEQLFRLLLPGEGEPISVERLIADLDHSKSATTPVAVKNDPPPIFYSPKPAILLVVDGKPVLGPIEKTDLQFVVNTNWDLFFEKSNKQYYLLADKVWLVAGELSGPWKPSQNLPKDMAKLPANENWTDVKKMIPPPPPSGAAPQVFFSGVPAELLLFKGAPVYSPIAGTRLVYASNTDADVFVDDADKQYYVLLSGRWFRSKALEGPWGYAGNDLPSDFAKIPSTSPKARVLASVPGTTEASDAVLLAQVPTTVTVNKAEAEAEVNVHYDGSPQFQPIEKTSLQYATNTQDKVIKDGDLFYLCLQGVWFTSTSAKGPWKTADTVPKDVYSIPPSSPVYNVTYVTQTNATPTTVECSTTAGYLGMFAIGTAAGMALAFGTGYYYPPYVYWGPMYPIYRPWPYTYGAAAVYNPWTGGFAVGHAAYGPYGAAGASAWYNPATGRYGRSASVQGWYGGRTIASSYNPWTGGYGATVQNHNPYAQWGHSTGVRGGQVIQTGHVTTAGGTIAGYRTSSGQRGVAYRGSNGAVIRGNNNTYAGADGNVYRKNSSDSWSKYNNGRWSQVDTSAARQQASQNLQNARGRTVEGQPSLSTHPDTLRDLDRSSFARQRGQRQTQRFQNFHRFGGGRFRR